MLTLIMVMVDFVQETLSFVVPDCQKFRFWRKFHTPYIPQRSLGCRPIRENRPSWNMEEF